MDATIALQNEPTEIASFRPNAKAAFEFTHANILGTTRYNLNVTEKTNEDASWNIPGIYGGIGHQISTGWSPVSAITLGVNYSSPEEVGVSNRHRIAVNASLSGRIGIMGWSLSGVGNFMTDNILDSYWNASLSTSFTLSRTVWLSASMGIGGGLDEAPAISGRIGATLHFGKVGVNTSIGTSSSYINARYSSERHSVNASATTYSYTDITGLDVEASYAYSGDYVHLDAGVDSTRGFNTLGADFTIGTSSVFADGLFAFQSYAPSNYVLISQKGALKGNSISIGSPGSSTMEEAKTALGVTIYDGLPGSASNDSFIVYSQGDSSFATFDSFPVNIPASNRMGYVLRLDAEATYTASGLLVMPDGIPYINGSSPMYKVTINDGVVTTELTDSYIFTDSDGRFTTESLLPGMYAFDAQYGDEWLLIIFNIKDDTNTIGLMQILKQEGEIEAALPAVYSGAIIFTFDEAMNSDEFFSMIYGGFAV